MKEKLKSTESASLGLWDRLTGVFNFSAKENSADKQPSSSDISRLMAETADQIRASVDTVGEDNKSSTEATSTSATTSGSSSATSTKKVKPTSPIIYPSNIKMVQEVSFAIKKEINLCMKKAQKISNRKGFFAYESQKLVIRARGLNELLKKLANATKEFLQNLYREWVAGKTIN